jgi:hypothetical protein
VVGLQIAPPRTPSSSVSTKSPHPGVLALAGMKLPKTVGRGPSIVTITRATAPRRWSQPMAYRKGDRRSPLTKTLRRHIEFIDFMNDILADQPGKDIPVLDNLNTHKPKYDRWLKRRPKVHFPFTPTPASWLNQSRSGSHPREKARARRLLHSRQCSSGSTSMPSSEPTTSMPSRSPGPRPRCISAASKTYQRTVISRYESTCCATFGVDLTVTQLVCR